MNGLTAASPTAKPLIAWVCDARRRTLELVADLSDEQLLGPKLATVNPFLWEIGHVAWFQEKWVLSGVARQKPVLADATALYDSSAVSHDTRWDLRLPTRERTIRYLEEVRDRVVDWLQQGELKKETVYFVLLSVFHEDMHTEAFTCTRQTLAYPVPRLSDVTAPDRKAEPAMTAGPLSGDVAVSGGNFWLGAAPEEPFVFDNEKWAHLVQVEPFSIARAPVTQAEFCEFVDAGGYRRTEFWSDAGRRWRAVAAADHPVYWRRDDNGAWRRRDFDRWVELEPYQPVVHVNWYEAEAYCRFAGRRLPTELEWEYSATGARKRAFPWGNAPPTPRHANLDWTQMGCVPVSALPDGDSAVGCRQMIGNVWEWTASDFSPYPGFVADPYQEYSAPWFGTHKVLRGGSWATRGRLLRNTFRNYYLPERRDVFAGFRTCAVQR